MAQHSNGIHNRFKQISSEERAEIREKFEEVSSTQKTEEEEEEDVVWCGCCPKISGGFTCIITRLQNYY